MRDNLFDIELHRLVDSPSQPRSTYSGIEALADSILQHGLLQPIICRPITNRQIDTPPEADLEIVCGHRRTRALRYIAAAREDNSLTIQAIIKPMSDLEVLQTQIIENGQREDVTPLDEARAYAALRDMHGQTTGQIADALAVSKRHVQARLQLLNLTGTAREALTRGEIGSEIAVLIAGLPSLLHDRAFESVTARDQDNHLIVLSLRNARDALRTSSMLHPIMNAPFEILDGSLIDCAGACLSCPNSSTHMGTLAEDIGTDICTDSTCWNAKTHAHGDSELDRLRDQGWTVLNYAPASVIHAHQMTDEMVEKIKAHEPNDPGITSICIAWPDPVTGLPVKGWTMDGRARYFRSEYRATPHLLGPAHTPRGRGEDAETTVATMRDTSDRDPVTMPTSADIDVLNVLKDRVIEGILTTDNDRTEDELLYITAELCSMVAPELLIRLNLPYLYSPSYTEELLDMLRSRDARTLGRIALAAVVDRLRDTYNYKKVTEILTLLAPRYAGGEGDKASLASEASTDSAGLPADESAEVKSDLPARRPAAKNKAVKYADPATGQTWTGRGLKPRWLVNALDAGHTLSDFETGSKQTDDGALAAAGTTAEA